MSLKETNPTNLTTDELDKKCQEIIGLPLERLIEVVTVLGQVQRLMDGELYLQRFAGLLRSTNKEDPLDCSYVRMCVIDWLKRPDAVAGLFQGISAARDLLNPSSC